MLLSILVETFHIVISDIIFEGIILFLFMIYL